MTPNQHINRAEEYAEGARDIARIAGMTIDRDTIPQLQVMATLAHTHAAIAQALLLQEATEYGGALKVSAEVS